MSVTGSENGDEDVEMEDPDNDVVEGDEEGAGTDGDGDTVLYFIYRYLRRRDGLRGNGRKQQMVPKRNLAAEKDPLLERN